MSVQLQEAHGIPVPDIGAPDPIVVVREGAAVIVYVSRTGEKAAVSFRGVYALQFGPPNDEAISGHSLAAFGLNPYGRYIVKNSPWLEALEQMNAVHPLHQPGFLARHQHFVIAFHDTLFECAAEGFELVPAEAATRFLSGKEK